MSHHITLGKRGEDAAATYLEQHGFVLRERNWRCHAGEIDLVTFQGDELVFVEVKARRSTDCGHPFEALTPTKVARLYRLAVLWCADRGWRGAFRIDAVAVIVAPDAEPEFEHLVGIQ